MCSQHQHPDSGEAGGSVPRDPCGITEEQSPLGKPRWGCWQPDVHILGHSCSWVPALSAQQICSICVYPEQDPRPGSPKTLTGFFPNLLGDVARSRPAAELPQGICWRKGHRKGWQSLIPPSCHSCAQWYLRTSRGREGLTS